VTATARTEILNAEFNGSVTTAGRFHEGERQLEVDVAALAQVNPEGSKEIAEQVVEVNEVAQVNVARLIRESAGTKGRFAKPIVGCALLWIAEDLVGRIQVGEALMG
jgi:hypothetical protein